MQMEINDQQQQQQHFRNYQNYQEGNGFHNESNQLESSHDDTDIEDLSEDYSMELTSRMGEFNNHIKQQHVENNKTSQRNSPSKSAQRCPPNIANPSSPKLNHANIFNTQQQQLPFNLFQQNQQQNASPSFRNSSSDFGLTKQQQLQQEGGGGQVTIPLLDLIDHQIARSIKPYKEQHCELMNQFLLFREQMTQRASQLEHAMMLQEKTIALILNSIQTIQQGFSSKQESIMVNNHFQLDDMSKELDQMQPMADNLLSNCLSGGELCTARDDTSKSITSGVNYTENSPQQYTQNINYEGHAIGIITTADQQQQQHQNYIINTASDDNNDDDDDEMAQQQIQQQHQLEQIHYQNEDQSLLNDNDSIFSIDSHQLNNNHPANIVIDCKVQKDVPLHEDDRHQKKEQQEIIKSYDSNFVLKKSEPECVEQQDVNRLLLPEFELMNSQDNNNSMHSITQQAEVSLKLGLELNNQITQTVKLQEEQEQFLVLQTEQLKEFQNGIQYQNDSKSFDELPSLLHDYQNNCSQSSQVINNDNTNTNNSPSPDKRTALTNVDSNLHLSTPLQNNVKNSHEKESFLFGNHQIIQKQQLAINNKNITILPSSNDKPVKSFLKTQIYQSSNKFGLGSSNALNCLSTNNIQKGASSLMSPGQANSLSQTNLRSAVGGPNNNCFDALSEPNIVDSNKNNGRNYNGTQQVHSKKQIFEIKPKGKTTAANPTLNKGSLIYENRDESGPAYSSSSSFNNQRSSIGIVKLLSVSNQSDNSNSSLSSRQSNSRDLTKNQDMSIRSPNLQSLKQKARENQESASNQKLQRNSNSSSVNYQDHMQNYVITSHQTPNKLFSPNNRGESVAPISGTICNTGGFNSHSSSLKKSMANQYQHYSSSVNKARAVDQPSTYNSSQSNQFSIDTALQKSYMSKMGNTQNHFSLKQYVHN